MEEEEEETVAAATTMAEGATAETRVDESRNAPPLKVVVAVDASEESLDALSWALDNILRGRPDAALVVVHAQNLICPAAGHGRRRRESSRRVVARRALKICEAKQVNTTAAAVEGDAKEAICQAAEQMQAALLVLGGRGLGRIKREFLGSVSDYLVHQASCPVLVVKPPKAHAK